MSASSKDEQRQRVKVCLMKGRQTGAQSMCKRLEEAEGPTYLERLMVRVDNRLFLIKTIQIDWIEAAGNYVRVHRGKESSLVRQSIGRLEAHLNPRQFLRIHRSAIVNLDRIEELEPLFHGDFRLLLHDGTQLTLSRRYRQRFQQVVGATLISDQ